MSGSTEKGAFHRATGIPFWTFVSGGGAAHREKKRSLAQEVIRLEEKKTQQLQISQDLARQRQQVEDNIALLQEVSGEAKTKLGKIEQKRIEVEKRMDDRRVYVVKPDVRNAPGAIFWGIISKIPVLGPVIGGAKTTIDIVTGAKNELEDRRTLKKLAAKAETHSGFKEATDTYTAELETQAKDLLGKETASLNAIKTLQHAVQTTKEAEQKY